MDAVQILAEAGIHLKHWRCGQHYVPCPRCTTRKSDQHLSVLVTPEGHAMWKCWRCGDFSGSTAALARKAEWERRRARTAPKASVPPGPSLPRVTAHGAERPGADPQASRPVPEVNPVAPAEGEAPGQVAFEARHAAFWEGLEPIGPDCPVGRYLLGRGCPLPSCADLRWHPDFGYTRPGSNWRGPAMIGLVTDALTARPMSFHFTWVRPDGHGKAPLERPRLNARGMAKQGGVIRLCDDADLGGWLMVGEGIETMLTMQKHTGLQSCWSCLDAGNLGQLPLPDWLRELVVVADHDKLNERTGKRPGLEAADKLVERCARSGTVHKVRVAYPLRERTDFNDVGRARDGNAGGTEAVA